MVIQDNMTENEAVSALAKGSGSALVILKILVRSINKVATSPDECMKVLRIIDGMEIYGAKIVVLFRYVCQESYANIIILGYAFRMKLVTKEQILKAVKTFDKQAFDFETLAVQSGMKK